MSIDAINQLNAEEVALARMAAAREQQQFFVFPHRLASGEIRQVEVYVSPVLVGGQALLFSIIHDATQRLQAEAALRQAHGELAARGQLLQNIYDTVSVGILLVNPQGVITHANQRMSEMFAYPPQRLVGLDYMELVHPSARSQGRENLQALLRGDIDCVDLERLFLRADGGEFWGRITGRRMGQGSATVGLVGSIEDITQRKRFEAELVQARDAAQAANQAKSAFLANMSHEIRTPLTAVTGLTDLLLDGAPTPTQRAHLQQLSSAAHSLLGLLGGILDYAKIEADKLTLESRAFDLADVVDATVGLFAISAQAKGLTLHRRVAPDVPAVLLGDPLRLRQVLNNLLGNAVKFTEQGRVELTVSTHKDPDDQPWLEVAVTDTGIGIDAEHLQHLFSPFDQADASTTRRFGGTGLGLAISQRLAQLMGGSLSAHSTPGQGSRFVLRLPLQTAPQDLAAVTGAATPKSLADVRKQLQAQAGAAVLLVEDNPTNQSIAREILEKLGLQVTCAGNGLQAVAQARLRAFDLILMDLHMPQLDGLAATRQIRRLDPHAQTPIVAMTAAALDTDRQACQRAGMNGFLAKPLDLGELAQTLLRWVPPAAQRPRPAPAPAAEVGADAAPVALPGWELEPALARLGGDWRLLRAGLRGFLRDFASAPQRLDVWVGQRDWTPARGLVHAIKGTALAIGACALHPAAGRLEQELESQQAASFPEFRHALVQVLHDLQHCPGLKPGPTAAAAAPEATAWPQQAQDLLTRLKQAEFIPPEAFRALQEQRPAHVSPQDWADLLERIERFDYAGAQSRLTAMLPKPAVPTDPNHDSSPA